jgi:hypothetical protein
MTDYLPTTTENTTNSLIPVPKIFDMEFTNLFFNLDTKKFYLKKQNRKVKSVRSMKELAWNEIKPKYKRKDGSETIYKYRYVLVPKSATLLDPSDSSKDSQYVRVKEGELEKFLSNSQIV